MIGFPLRSRDEEKRKLRCHVADLERANKAHKEARKRIEKENRELRRENKELRRKNKQLEQEKEEFRRQRDRYRNMLFKPNVKGKQVGEEKKDIGGDGGQERDGKGRRGAKMGHSGKGRNKPTRVDKWKQVYLTHCPICGKEVKRSDKINTHTVEDIPVLEKYKAEVTCYQIEEQWCSFCKKRVRAHPAGVIPKSRLGINILIYVLIQKYGARSSWASIIFNLATYFNIHVSEGSLVSMMHRARNWLGPYYEQILEDIRGSPVKYADETQWRVDGINQWLWGVFTEKAAYYTVEESRGKAVAEGILKDSHTEDILVRDDYPGYKNLPLKHQSCWAHLLRNARESAEDPNASGEVKTLHKQLQDIYGELSDILKIPLNEKGREKYYDLYSIKIQEIVEADYKHDDARSIQTRIANQNTNLITALRYKGVPLTNNLAERYIRPFVIARKMSGGSRSNQGAKTQAVNMSIFQTIKIQNLPMITTLKEYLLTGCRKN